MSETEKELKGIEPVKPADELSESVKQMRMESVRMLLDVFSKEANEFKLDRMKREILRDSLDVDTEIADRWGTAADVIKHFDSAELVRKYPEQAKSVLLTVLSAFPPTAIAAMLLRFLPSETISKVMGGALTLSPDHLVRMLADHQANASRERAAAYMNDPPAEEGKIDLVMVSKDDALFSQLRKLVESKDDEEDIVIGVKDGACRILRWDEKKWLYRSRMEAVSAKTLIIGDVKDAEKGADFMDVKFDKYGVKYGWTGNTAYVTAERAALRPKGAYGEFLAELSELPVPEYIKKDNKLKLSVKTGLKVALATPLIAKDIHDDNKAVLRQMLFYGVIRFYYDHLEAFLNS